MCPCFVLHTCKWTSCPLFFRRIMATCCWPFAKSMPISLWVFSSHRSKPTSTTNFTPPINIKHLLHERWKKFGKALNQNFHPDNGHQKNSVQSYITLNGCESWTWLHTAYESRTPTFPCDLLSDLFTFYIFPNKSQITELSWLFFKIFKNIYLFYFIIDTKNNVSTTCSKCSMYCYT